MGREIAVSSTAVAFPLIPRTWKCKMPRPYPPPHLPGPTVIPFHISGSEKRDLAKVPGLDKLSAEVSGHAVSLIAALTKTLVSTTVLI
jgi:hypothetical protein